MDPISATYYCLRHPFKFSGRASRSEFWWFQLVYILIAMAGMVFVLGPFLEQVMIASSGAQGMSDAELIQMVMALDSNMTVYYCVMLWPFVAGLSVTVRRLHDVDYSGWWYWIILVPFIGVLILLILLVCGSSSGRNRYGPPPGGGLFGMREAVPQAPAKKVIPKGLPGEPYNPINELTTAEELRALRQSRMQTT